MMPMMHVSPLSCPDSDGRCRQSGLRVPNGCEREHKAMRAAAKRSKPAGYTWPLYNQPRKPYRVPAAHINRTTHPLAWVQAGLAGSVTFTDGWYERYCVWNAERREWRERQERAMQARKVRRVQR